MDNTKINQILDLWSKEFLKILNIQISGSPERSIERYAILTKSNQKFILEKIEKSNFKRRVEIALNLECLDKKLNFITPYIKNKEGEFVTFFENNYWQLQCFVPGDELSRQDYWKSETRGRNLIKSLLQLYEVDKKNNLLDAQNFSLVSYIENLMNVLRNRDIAIYKQVLPIFKILKNDFFKYYLVCEKNFCHGDPHPLNVIWSKDSVLKLIDWEFSGYKAKLYDIALIIGCVGSESKDALSSGFIQGVKKEIKKHQFLNSIDFNQITNFVVAIRFAWLSEWIRKKDNKMINFEIFYMNLLINNKIKL